MNSKTIQGKIIIVSLIILIVANSVGGVAYAITDFIMRGCLVSMISYVIGLILLFKFQPACWEQIKKEIKVLKKKINQGDHPYYCCRLTNQVVFSFFATLLVRNLQKQLPSVEDVRTWIMENGEIFSVPRL